MHVCLCCSLSHSVTLSLAPYLASLPLFPVSFSFCSCAFPQNQPISLSTCSYCPYVQLRWRGDPAFSHIDQRTEGQVLQRKMMKEGEEGEEGSEACLVRNETWGVLLIGCIDQAGGSSVYTRVNSCMFVRHCSSERHLHTWRWFSRILMTVVHHSGLLVELCKMVPLWLKDYNRC